MPLAVTMNNQQFSNAIDYWYYEFPSIYMLDPNRGPDTGGTHVLLKGNNFDPFVDLPISNHNDTMCRFGQLGLVPVTVINSTKMVCISPPSYILREVDVEITLNNQEWTRDGNIFYYYRPPFVFDIDPLMGPVAGGTVVHVHGSNFEDTGAIRCKFGENTVPGEYININELMCTAPKVEKPGYVTFQVAVHEDDFSSPDLFRYLYYDTPVIRYIDPTCGPERGYTQIIVYGDNFIDTGFDMVYCIFNGTIFMNATVFEPDKIKCSSPSVLNRQGVNERQVKFYDLTITFNKKDQSGPAKRFSYYKEVSIKSVTPNGGPIEGGTIVRLTGLGFRPECACNATVRIGTFQVKPLNFTENIIFVKTPNVTLPDDVVMSYGINGQQYNPDPNLNVKDPENTFTFYSKPIVTDYRPRRGPSVGGTQIKIFGFGFTPFKDNEGRTINRPVWVRMRKGSNVTEPKAADYVDNENVHWSTPPGEPDTNHILELSLNKEDYIQILPINQTFSYTYYNSPRVTSLYSSFGPVSATVPIMLFVKGKNFNCDFDQCKHVSCRFGKGDQSIYVPATRISSTEVHCYVPKYGRPDVVPVEISLDDEYYTNDNKEYGFYDPFVWNVEPKLISRRGNTTLTIKGYGFVNTTDTYLKVRFGFLHKRLRCQGGACIVKARYIDKNTIMTESFAYSDVVYESTGQEIGKDDFAVEVSVYGDDFTKNNISIKYFIEPTYGNPIPSQVTANGNDTILIHTDFHTTGNKTNKDVNDESLIFKYGKPKCRFTSINGKFMITKAIMVHYPLAEDGPLNAIFCPSPEWDLPEGAESENVFMDVTVNGADYSGAKVLKITEKLAIYRIYPPCGPTYGNTRMRIFGTGFKTFEQLQLKWGVLNMRLIEKGTMTAFVYSKDKALSNDPYENEIVSMNEEVRLVFKNTTQYQSAYSYSPRLINWDRTHGGQVYIALGRGSNLDLFTGSKPLSLQYYGPSYMEYYYYQQPFMKDMKPRAGPTTGGTVLIIRGSWFKYMPEYGVIPYIRIGDKVSRCEFESTVRIICRSPPNNYTEGNLQVAIGLNGVDFGEQVLSYHYYYPPIIEDISPKSGPESGGSRIHMLGKQFSNLSSPSEFRCRFTDLDRKFPPKYIPAVYENSSSIICPSPGGWSAGTKVNIEITFNGIDYTNSNSTFTFYSIFSATPRSGPSDGTAGILLISGNGFRDASLAACLFDKTRYKPIEVTLTTIKCRIPRAKHGDDFFGTVPLELTINGIDQHTFVGGFHYYPQINVTDFYPKTGPAKGSGIIKFYGARFRQDFALAKPVCRFGPYVGPAEVLSDGEMICHLPHIDVINQTYKGEVALNEQSFVIASSNADFVPYGVYDMEPYSGPLGIQTQITVTGEGFTRDGKAKCRFGVPGNYAMLEGQVLTSQKMICYSPKDFQIPPKIMEIPFAVPFSISFFDEKINPWTGSKFTPNKKGSNVSAESKFDPWTQTGHVFRFYIQPVIVKLSPPSCKVNEIIDVFAYTSPKTPFIEPIYGINKKISDEGVKCNFGRFGVTPAMYINATTVKCVTPSTNEDPESIQEELVHVQVAINGYDFTEENEAASFTFIGEGTVFDYWPYIIGLILVLLAILAILSCCSAMLQKAFEPKPQEEEMLGERAGRPEGAEDERSGNPKKGPALGGKPHTLRDEFGFYRTRGYFQQNPAASPLPGQRSTVYGQRSIGGKSVVRSPGGSYIP